MNGTIEKTIQNLMLEAQSQIFDGKHSQAAKTLKRVNRLLTIIASRPFVGQVVSVVGGDYNGCILTYIGTDELTGKPICQHSDHLGGLRVDRVTPVIA